MQRLHERLTDASGVYFDGTLIDSVRSPYQLIEVFDTPALGKLMRIDGANMVSERDEFFYHEALVHPAAVSHPGAKSVLIVGGGDGGSAEEVLKDNAVERCVLAELDEAVVDVSKAHFQSVHRSVFSNPRLDLRIGDGMAYVSEAIERFDLIYLDLTDPIGPSEALYAPPFFANCQRALNPGGALVLHIGSPFSHPERVTQTLGNLRSLYRIVTPYFVHIPIYGATWGFAVASDSLELAHDAATVDARLQARDIGARQLYNGAVHVAMLALPEYVDRLVR
ncbi:MAG: polyamine aminopropyltransferase [Betaproteobacteria bacterium]|nr:polyamine aminopropyltransferase [Betaproteobacteria bacterium]